MSSHLIRLACSVALACAVAPFAGAQAGGRAAPHLAFVYPAGGQQGTTFTVSVGGQNLNSTAAAHFSGRGLAARIKHYERPLTQKEINDLREEQQALQEKRTAARTDEKKPPFTAADEKRTADIRQLLAGRGNRQLSPVLAETVILEVTIDGTASPGEHELRLRTPTGLSNPMVFCVGQLPEVTVPARIATSIAANSRPSREIDPQTKRPMSEREITLPAVVNGQILPGEVSRFRFVARRGQRIVMAANARGLIPYLADAVPGWFQATLGLLDAHGRELAYADDYRFNPDPILCFDIPADGAYVFEIKDAIFRGREDFVYRVTIGELPFVTGIFPLGAALASAGDFTLTGWNLPARQLALDTKDRAPGTLLIAARAHGQLSSPVRITLDGLADRLEAEPNDHPEAAESIMLPIAMNGRILRPGDRDVFRFDGKAGEEIVAEVFARRLGSPLDAVLKLTDAGGRQVALNDDSDDRGSGLLTHQADSRLACKLPADGTYFLTLADTQHQGGPDHSYRLVVGPPRPDFALRVTPSSVNLRAGGSAAVTVYALRHDGFTGEIALQLRDAPPGFGLGGARIPANADKIQVTITAPLAATDTVSRLTLSGFANIGGKPVERPAVPAEDMMQAFAYRHLVPSRALMVDVTGRGASFRLVSKPPVRLVPGGSARVQIAVPAARNAGKVHFELLDPPDGISVQQTTTGSGDLLNVTITCDAAKAKPGTQGNLLLTAFGVRPTAKGTPPGKGASRTPLGTVPAIPYAVIAAAPAGTD